MKNLFVNQVETDEDDNGCCPRTLLLVNDNFKVNTLLDGGAVPNIISLTLVKQLGIKELTRTHINYITANGDKSQALGIAENIMIKILGLTLKISAIVYDHSAFPLLLGRKTLKMLGISTDWKDCSWHLTTPSGVTKKIPINFGTKFGVQVIQSRNFKIEEENDNLKSDSELVQSEDEDLSFTYDNEVYVHFSDQIEETQSHNLKIFAGQPEITVKPAPLSTPEDIKLALEKTISKIPLKFRYYSSDLRHLLFEYLDIFGTSHQNLRPINILQFDIDTGNEPPVYIKAKPLPYKYKEFAKSELDAAVKAGTMTGPLKGLCTWGFPVWVVAKPKTNELRMVGDFRILNKKTKPDESAIPDMHETVESMSESVVFSPLDLLKAVNQIQNTQRAKERLVITTEWGNYQHNVMPFGPTNAPFTFAKATVIGFAHLISTLATYFDDLTCHSKDPKQHLAHIRQVFAVMRKYNFTLRPEKCLFY